MQSLIYAGAADPYSFRYQTVHTASLPFYCIQSGRRVTIDDALKAFYDARGWARSGDPSAMSSPRHDQINDGKSTSRLSAKLRGEMEQAYNVDVAVWKAAPRLAAPSHVGESGPVNVSRSYRSLLTVWKGDRRLGFMICRPRTWPCLLSA